jgi:hypothetical protein
MGMGLDSLATLNMNLSSLQQGPAGSSSSMASGSGSTSHTTKRGRSSSILSMHEIKENYDDALDQSAMANLNADWVNYKGAFMTPVLSLRVTMLIVLLAIQQAPGSFISFLSQLERSS